MKIPFGSSEQQVESCKLKVASWPQAPAVAPLWRGRPAVNQPATFNQQPATLAGLTLVEMMISVTLFGMMVIGFILLQMFGLKQNQLAESKLGASDQARRAFSQMVSEIHSTKTWYIGNLSGSTFTPVTTNAVQQGKALQLHLNNNTNQNIRYYFSGNTLFRTQTGVTGAEVIAADLTNTMVFRAENHLGQVQTNRAWRNVIRVMLEFAQFQYPTTTVGPGSLYDYYKLEFKATPHCPRLP